MFATSCTRSRSPESSPSSSSRGPRAAGNPDRGDAPRLSGSSPVGAGSWSRRRVPAAEELAGRAASCAGCSRQPQRSELEPWVDSRRPVRCCSRTRLRPGEDREPPVFWRRSTSPSSTMSNGLHVFLKPTDFQDDTILFHGVALGRHLRRPTMRELLSAEMASGIVAESGWGGHSPVDLDRLLAGKVASARPYFQERWHGVSGSSTVKDLADRARARGSRDDCTERRSGRVRRAGGSGSPRRSRTGRPIRRPATSTGSPRSTRRGNPRTRPLTAGSDR